MAKCCGTQCTWCGQNKRVKNSCKQLVGCGSFVRGENNIMTTLFRWKTDKKITIQKKAKTKQWLIKISITVIRLFFLLLSETHTHPRPLCQTENYSPLLVFITQAPTVGPLNPSKQKHFPFLHSNLFSFHDK